MAVAKSIEREGRILRWRSTTTYSLLVARPSPDAGVILNAVKNPLPDAQIGLWPDARLGTSHGRDRWTKGLLREAHSIGVQVADVRFIPAEGESPFQCAAILEEIVDGPVGVTPRRLPLWIGSFEGEMLALALAMGRVAPSSTSTC